MTAYPNNTVHLNTTIAASRNRQTQPVSPSWRAGLATVCAGVMALSGFGALSVLGGCYGAPPKPLKPESEDERFAGLPMSLDSSGIEHVVIVQTPTAGYQCSVDYIAESFEGRDVFVLIREPNPLYVYSTSIHPARVLTGVESKTFVRVLAQQVPHGAKVDREGYRVVNLAMPNPSSIKSADKAAEKSEK